MDHILLLCSSIDGLDSFHLLVSVNHATMNMSLQILGWPNSLFGFFRNILQKNLNKIFGQPNTCLSLCFQSFWVYTQKWSCWFIW